MKQKDKKVLEILQMKDEKIKELTEKMLSAEGRISLQQDQVSRFADRERRAQTEIRRQRKRVFVKRERNE